MIKTTTATNPEIQTKMKRILIVDDALQVRSNLCNLLKMVDGLEIVGEAGNGAEAFIQADHLRPDVILMDLEMPFLNGYEATRQIKAHLPACRVIVLSVHSYTEARQRANQAGADAFIEKGEPLANLVNAIRKES